jgi:hypothetical protein
LFGVKRVIKQEKMTRRREACVQEACAARYGRPFGAACGKEGEEYTLETEAIYDIATFRIGKTVGKHYGSAQVNKSSIAIDKQLREACKIKNLCTMLEGVPFFRPLLVRPRAGLKTGFQKKFLRCLFTCLSIRLLVHILIHRKQVCFNTVS